MLCVCDVTLWPQVLRQLPVDVGQTASTMKVGFITFSNVVHFFNCNVSTPEMLLRVP